jgi:dipeptidyl aminopeptidase/acylaminoacyl peptidase
MVAVRRYTRVWGYAAALRFAAASLFVMAESAGYRPAAAAEISSKMLVEMREITSVSASPDGARAVIGISRSNIESNAREVSWMIVPLMGSSKPVTLTAGKEIYEPGTVGGLLNVRAQWSGDGHWFFYLRREGEEVQLWQTDWKGENTRQVTHSNADLIGLSASTDPNELLVQLAPERDVLRKAEEEEDRAGILYDDHVMPGYPLAKTLPAIDRWRNVRRTDDGQYVPPGWGTRSAVFNIRTRELKVSGDADAGDDAAGTKSGQCRVNCVENQWWRATAVKSQDIISAHPDEPFGQFTVQIEPKSAAGKTVGRGKRCAIAECLANRITVLGWSADGHEIYYVADSRQGMVGARLPGQAAIYAWNPTRNATRLIRECGGEIYTLDAPLGLEPTGVRVIDGEIVVAASGADEPPRLESINLSSGTMRTLLDPNAELRSLTHGRAAWHTWGGADGYPGRGIVVLPDDFKPEVKYPLLITSYQCGNGFLRGGGSDNAPEFVAAHAGFVAICVDIPVWEILSRESDMSRMYPIACDIVAELIVDQERKGSVDASRVALSGHSFGANFGNYCLAHSMGQDPAHGIAAAAFRHGSVLERAQWDLFNTAAYRRDPVNGIFARMHMPDPRHDPTGRWNEMSSANKAATINTPILIQDDDTEYWNALPLWSALREEGKAVEMYVFPKETHQLIQPVHQMVNFESRSTGSGFG